VDIAAFKKRLQRKEQDLQADIARHEAEARDDARPEVHDQMDQVTSSEDSEGQLRQTDLDSQVLVQVREALARIEQGAYGKCIDCGRRIEPSRLAAIPWTPYCLDDQQRHDRLSGPTNEPTL
jgi:DnaK suppressor protein